MCRNDPDGMPSCARPTEAVTLAVHQMQSQIRQSIWRNEEHQFLSVSRELHGCDQRAWWKELPQSRMRSAKYYLLTFLQSVVLTSRPQALLAKSRPAGVNRLGTSCRDSQ